MVAILAVPINTHYFREDYLGKAIQALTDLANAVGPSEVMKVMLCATRVYDGARCRS